VTGRPLRRLLVGLLQDRLSLGGQTVDVLADELLRVCFALEEKILTDPREQVGSLIRHRQGELLHLGSVDELGFHAASSSGSLRNLSWSRVHSAAAMSSLTPRYTGWKRLPLAAMVYRYLTFTISPTCGIG